ncbi:MAG: hypothetical protein BWY91_01888 [bacterium ADurb.BinA028]|nr:MAG: hypothetical protein BWY91_01888 [bacterium ADurb.BinA028]
MTIGPLPAAVILAGVLPVWIGQTPQGTEPHAKNRPHVGATWAKASAFFSMTVRSAVSGRSRQLTA